MSEPSESELMTTRLISLLAGVCSTITPLLCSPVLGGIGGPCKNFDKAYLPAFWYLQNCSPPLCSPCPGGRGTTAE